MNSLSSGYRVFCWPWWKHWFSAGTYWYWAKYKIQRANRGWADCDVWSLDNYLAEWLPDALKRLKETAHGVPMSMFPEGTIDDTDTHIEIASKNWDIALLKMIDGFEAYNRMQDSPSSYESEIGDFPSLSWNFEPTDHDTHKLVRTSEENSQMDAWMAKEKPLLERDRKIWEEGAALFIKNFGDLWD